MECTHNRTANVVSQIPRADEQDVDTGDLGNLLDLIDCQLSVLRRGKEMWTYILKRLLCFDLDNCEKRIIRCLEIFHRRNIPR